MMLEDLFKKQLALDRHRATVFGPYLDDYVEDLWRVGHRHPVIRRNLHLITRFGEYIAAQDVCDIQGVERTHVTSFLGRERRRLRRVSPTWRRRAPVVGYILDGFLQRLEVRGFVRRDDDVTTTLCDEFYTSLAVERGLSPRTIENYRHFLNEFLRHLRSDGSAETLTRITSLDVDQFIVRFGRTYGRRSMGLVCTAIRVLLRFLYRRSILGHDLSAAVILPRYYALERLPCALPWENVRRVLGAVDISSERGLRDRAILTLLVTYAVRPGEIVKLCLEDIDWRSNTICFRRSKNGRPLSFPLTVDCGEAVVRYLRRGRPTTTAREVFVRADAPFVALRRGSVVSNLVRLYLVKAGIESRHMGAGVIRHSLAVRLVRKRHPLKTVSDMLGHRNPRVAYQYTKLAIEDLHGVALDARDVLP